MKAVLIFLTLIVLSAMIFASPANPSDGKPSVDLSKQVNAQPKDKATPPNGASKNSANQDSPAKKPASSKAKVSNQAPPKGKENGENKPSQAPTDKPTEKPEDKATKRFVAFKSGYH